MENLIKKLGIPAKIILVVVLASVVVYLFQIRSEIVTLSRKVESLSSAKFECGLDCRSAIFDEVKRAVTKTPTSTPTPTDRPTSTPTPVKAPSSTSKTPEKSSQTTYIPLGGSGSTTAIDWTDLANTGVYIKASDYGTGPYITWEAFLKIKDANGETFARLYDATNNIAVVGSEISTKSGVFTQVSSGKLQFWAGNNLYRVQVKSLNSREAFFDNGRVKINY